MIEIELLPRSDLDDNIDVFERIETFFEKKGIDADLTTNDAIENPDVLYYLIDDQQDPLVIEKVESIIKIFKHLCEFISIDFGDTSLEYDREDE